ncbi:hypothetical protein GLOTRDRAFT_94857 [Gloeophyllum trabeum ATCC 11539]|uniref:Uncharacterized protein n=1 Tax=Gloeophyllum trabeum (strain ATCC 11539 / FP-39264 / Madison 617) TaxID=670483 RepID=S7Q154_GLOTA|nr:uncharacterized protein GLOTRDRAFT_94857 [Gloeophyllum trabeum ATCC 11539]EPQ53676.1 hypothetical protein GLOTRDRAFT_94857 [Gloeophyllum trabeum ATCC 11539]
MRFFTFVPIALAGLSALSGVFAQNPQAVITNVKAVTKISADLRVVVARTTVTNVFSQAPTIVTTLQKIVSTVTSAVSSISVSDPKPFTEEVSTEVVEVLTEFVKVHQALLQTIIGKHGLLARFAFATPVRLALVAIEKVVDSFAFAIINLIPTGSKKSEAQRQIASLDVTLKASIKTYS